MTIPIRPATLSTDAGLQRAPQSRPRVAVRALSSDEIRARAQGRQAVSRGEAHRDMEVTPINPLVRDQRPAERCGPGQADPKGLPDDLTRLARARTLEVTEGPAAVRSALERCFKAMADGFGRDWEQEEIERRARAWEQRQRHG
jgi:hypothetical protein